MLDGAARGRGRGECEQGWVGEGEGQTRPRNDQRNLPVSISMMGLRTKSRLKKWSCCLKHQFKSPKAGLAQHHTAATQCACVVIVT